MTRILFSVLMMMVLVFQSFSSYSQVFKLKKLQLGFQESAAGLFTCDNLYPHFTHLIIEKNNDNVLFLSMYNGNLNQDPFVYKLNKVGDNNVNAKIPSENDYLERVSPHGPRWSEGSILINGKKVSVKLEHATDQWNGKIYYIYTLKRTKSSKGLENYKKFSNH